MEQQNVHHTEPSEREDLKHVDTVSTGDEESTARRLGEEGGPIGLRVERDPSNLGNDIPEEGDLTHPSPFNEPLGKPPGA